MRLTLLPDGSQTYDIKRMGVRVSVGRKPGCDIQLSDIVVSGLHCYITVTSVVTALVEDASTNGTYVNGVKVGKGLTLDVKEGDILTMGKPGAESGSVSFKIGFAGVDDIQQALPSLPIANQVPNQGGSVLYKQEIEDLKVLVYQAQHRSEASERKAQEATLKQNSSEAELKRIKEDNVELTVRNDVMRREIDQLRVRLSSAERSVGDAEKKSESLQVKVDYMSKEFAEIAALKAAMNLKNTSLGDEIDRLRRENAELNNKIMITSDMKRQLITNLRSVQQLVGACTGMCENLDVTNNVIKRGRDVRGYPLMEPTVESAPKSPEVDKFYIGSGYTVTDGQNNFY